MVNWNWNECLTLLLTEGLTILYYNKVQSHGTRKGANYSLMWFMVQPHTERHTSAQERKMSTNSPASGLLITN